MNNDKSKSTILVLDEHEIFAEGIKLILENNLDVEVRYRFLNGENVLNYFKEVGQADLILLDLNLTQMDSLEFMELLQEEKPGLKILATSNQQSDAKIFLTRKLGAKGFIGKDSNLKDMLIAVKEVLQGDFYFPEEGKSLGGSLDIMEEVIKNLCKRFELSRSEIKIMNLILDRKNNKEIAHELYLSPLTVKNHRKNIYRKFGVQNLAGILIILKEELEKDRKG
ncbi:response regulator [Shivajiella indica]|uniref:Response regulator n=1 Tax=Shivajiella indica TaxID=872115 RepID=A0ABW5B5J0_9BACT